MVFQACREQKHNNSPQVSRYGAVLTFDPATTWRWYFKVLYLRNVGSPWPRVEGRDEGRVRLLEHILLLPAPPRPTTFLLLNIVKEYLEDSVSIPQFTKIS